MLTWLIKSRDDLCLGWRDLRCTRAIYFGVKRTGQATIIVTKCGTGVGTRIGEGADRRTGF